MFTRLCRCRLFAALLLMVVIYPGGVAYSEPGEISERGAPARVSSHGALRIMTLGDSITRGYGTKTNYRAPLGVRARAVGADITFVGPYNDNMTTEASQHAAYDGIKAIDIDARWITPWAQAHQPDMVLMHLGTNDLRGNIATNTVINALSSIIDKLRAVNPKVTIFVAQIIGSTNITLQARIVALNNEIEKLVAAKQKSQSPVYLVDQHTGFDPAVDTFDGLHPAVHGQVKMANKWLETMIDHHKIIPGKELSNLALNKPLSLSPGPITSYDISLAFDDSVAGNHFLRVAPAQWFELDLGAVYKLFYLDIVHFGLLNNEMPNEFRNTHSYSIEGSHDGINWESLAVVSDNTLGRTTHLLPGNEARYVRFNVIQANRLSNSDEFRLREFRVMGHPLH